MTETASMLRTRGLGKGIATVAVLLWVISSAIVVGASAHAADPGIPGLTDSAELKTPVVATGTAFASTGKPADAGEMVELVAWPPQVVLEGLAVGESVKTVPVGYAFTHADGSFDLRVSDDAFVDRYAEPSGLVSYEIRATVGGSPSSFSFVGATPSATADAARSAGTDVAVENVTVPTTGIALSPIPVISGRFEAESIPASDLREVSGSAEVPKTCVSTLVLDYGPQWVRVGEAYGVTGGKVTFVYASGASSTLGVGVSTTGSTGTFSASGTSTAASTVTQTYADRTSGAFYNTKFNYGKYRVVCSNGSAQTIYYTARFTSYAGGTSVSVPGSAPTATFCINHGSGSTLIDYSSAYEFSTGVSISSAIGINLSSKTGFNTKTSLKFTWTAPRRLCGSADYEGGVPKRLVAKT